MTEELYESTKEFIEVNDAGRTAAERGYGVDEDETEKGEEEAAPEGGSSGDK